MKTNEAVLEREEAGVCGEGIDILYGTVRQCLTEKMTLEQRPETSEGASTVGIQKQSIPNRGSSKCNCPEVGAFVVSLKKSQKVGVAGEKGAQKIAVGDKVTKVTTGPLA